VNLYVPSTLRWTHDGAQLSLTQRTQYPFDPHVAMELTASRPAELSLYFRIPAWANGASFRVNGKRIENVTATPGRFAEVRRTWKSGDQIDLELPLTKRLEPISSADQNTVALLSGPLVLFPIASAAPAVTREQLLAASMSSDRKWQAKTSGQTLTL